MVPAPFPITTPDGICPTRVFRPATGAGPWPGVVMFMDGIGIRQALFDMAQRLADAGYVVLLPDVFYRAGEYTAADPAQLFTGPPEVRQAWFQKFLAVATTANVMRDLPALLAALAAQPDVKPGRFGVTGYCLGGRLAIAAAGTLPDRFAAAASYHGGGLATDAPDSPHVLAAHITAVVYVAAADNDDPVMIQKLDEALTAAGVVHTTETYPAKHGWVPSDTPIHDAVQTERHWKTLIELLRSTIG
jgi:carboxymethylenebutenolidase